MMNTALICFLSIGCPSTDEPPLYASMLGIVVGKCTTEELEARIGRGEVQPGGHSDSGRVWEFQNCLIATDSFERSGNSLLVDYIHISSWKGRLGACQPFDSGKAFFMGSFVFGEKLQDSLGRLKKAGFKPTLTGNRIECQTRTESLIGHEKRELIYRLTLSGKSGLDSIVVTTQYR